MITVSGLEAWASGNMEEFGKLISASGLSSIQNYECGKTSWNLILVVVLIFAVVVVLIAAAKADDQVQLTYQSD